MVFCPFLVSNHLLTIFWRTRLTEIPILTRVQALGYVPGAERMVMGHTIQEEGINSACGGRAFRVDVGLSKGCTDGAVEVLEILNDTRIVRHREGLSPQVLADPSQAEVATSRSTTSDSSGSSNSSSSSRSGGADQQGSRGPSGLTTAGELRRSVLG